MLDIKSAQEIADTIHGSILCSGIEREIIGTSFFNRLHRILQSSLVYLTYPSNKVKRFEHSIGTMHLSGLFFSQSIYNTEEATLKKFFEEINLELIEWNKKINIESVPYIHPAVLSKFKNEKILEVPCPDNPIYNQNIPADLPVKYRFSYCVVYQSVRLVGLLHDIGHLPYSHILEHAMHLLYENIKEISEKDRKKSHNYFLKTMEKYCGNSNSGFELHEELGKRFVDKIFMGIKNDLRRVEEDSYYFLAAVFYFTKKILHSTEGLSENNIFADLHKIVAGTVDCDRMDYCCRDAYCAGITKDLPNYSRITSNLKIIYKGLEEPIAFKEPIPFEDLPIQTRKRFYFAPSTKAICQIEHLLEQRWSVFSLINYHHRVHKHELIMERAIAELGKEEMEQEKDQEPQNLEHILPLKLSSIWQLVRQLEEAAPIEYIALQLDDSWLDTLLKHKFFETYKNNYLSIKENAKFINWHRLDELISTKKHYFSLIKRSGEFRFLDELLYNSIKDKKCLKSWGIEGSDEGLNYAAFLSKGEYAFNKLIKNAAPTNYDRQKFFLLLENRVKDVIEEEVDCKVADCFLGDCAFKLGISQSEPLFITSPQLEPKPFSHYSSLHTILMTRKKLLPSFHVYYLPCYDDVHNEYFKADIEKFQKILVQCIVELINEMKNDNVTK